MDAECIGTFQRNWINDCAIFVIQRLFTHAIKALHRKDVELMTFAICLSDFQGLLARGIYHVLVFKGFALLGHYFPLACIRLLKFCSEMYLEVRVYILSLFVYLVQAGLDVDNCSVWTEKRFRPILAGDQGLVLPRLINMHHLQFYTIDESLFVQIPKVLLLTLLSVFALAGGHHHVFTRSLDRNVELIAVLAPR